MGLGNKWEVCLWIATGVLLVAFLLNFILKAGFFITNIAKPLPPFQLDFGAYYVAASVLNSDQPVLYDDRITESISQQVFKEKVKLPPYIYPPFFAWTLRPLALLPYSQAVVVWLVFNIILSVFIVIPLCRLAKLPLNWIAVGSVLLLVWIFPLTSQSALNVGQVNIIMLLLLILVAYYSDYSSSSKEHLLKDLVVGIAIGLAVGIKLFFAPLVLYFFFYNRRRIALISVITFLMTIAIGAAGAGVDNTSRYFYLMFPQLQQFGHNPNWLNFSLGPTIERMFSPASFERGFFFEKNLIAIQTSALINHPELGAWLGRIASGLLIILVTALLIYDWITNRNNPEVKHDLRVSILILTIMLCMPLSWSHSFILVLMPLVIIMSPFRRLLVKWEWRYSLSLLALALLMVNLNWNYIYFIMGWSSVPSWLLMLGTLGILIIVFILFIELLREEKEIDPRGNNQSFT